MKKIVCAILALTLSLSALCACQTPEAEVVQPEQTVDSSSSESSTSGTQEVTAPEKEQEEEQQEEQEEEVAGGYVTGKIGDFSVYENTSAYVKVSTADELITALLAAKYHYTNTWDDDTNTYTQSPASGYTEDNFKGTVHVIEIENDIDLGYNELSTTAKNSGIVDNWATKNTSVYTMSDMFTESGISKIKVETTSNLMVYSKNGAKITHGGFSLLSCDNVVFKNLKFDEMWQWEDAASTTASKVGDYDAFGWAYFKVSFCGYVWIDHCTFGKSYDGQIDYSNPDYSSNSGVASRAPYGADGGNGLHISNCNFNAGSSDEDGYLYKMMAAIEENYQANRQDSSVACNYLYYKTLREAGASFEQILYGIAIPQKKGFLCGDNSDEEYEYNKKLCISFEKCNFKNIEDRLPKLRGGNAVMYNCVVDCTQYYTYRAQLSSLGAKSVVTGVNSNWKCGLVSQGIVCGNGGSVYAENCIFKGIENLLKNNDSAPSGKSNEGGYKLVNCRYLKGATGTAYTGSSSDADNGFSNASTTTLTQANFVWRTPDGTQPFTIKGIHLDDLEETLSK